MVGIFSPKTTSPVVNPGFPRGGGANSPGGANIRFCKFYQKLHEMKEFGPQGERAPCAPLDLPLPVVDPGYHQRTVHANTIISGSKGRCQGLSHLRGHAPLTSPTLYYLTWGGVHPWCPHHSPEVYIPLNPPLVLNHLLSSCEATWLERKWAGRMRTTIGQKDGGQLVQLDSKYSADSSSKHYLAESQHFSQWCICNNIMRNWLFTSKI